MTQENLSLLASSYFNVLVRKGNHPGTSTEKRSNSPMDESLFAAQHPPEEVSFFTNLKPTEKALNFQKYRCISELLDDIDLSWDDFYHVIEHAKEIITSEKELDIKHEYKHNRTFSVLSMEKNEYKIIIYGKPLKGDIKVSGKTKVLKTDCLEVLYHVETNSFEFLRIVIMNGAPRRKRLQSKEDRNAYKDKINSYYEVQFTKEGWIKLQKTSTYFVYTDIWKGDKFSVFVEKLKKLGITDILIPMYVTLLKKMHEDYINNGTIYYDVKLENLLINRQEDEIIVVDLITEVNTFIHKPVLDVLIKKTEGEKIEDAVVDIFGTNSRLDINTSVFNFLLVVIKSNIGLRNNFFFWDTPFDRHKDDFSKTIEILKAKSYDRLADFFSQIYYGEVDFNYGQLAALLPSLFEKSTDTSPVAEKLLCNLLVEGV